MKNKKKDLEIGPIILIILGLGILYLIVIFIYKFSGTKASNSVEQWGQTGDYFSMVINFASAIVVSWLSWLVYNGQNQRDKWEKKLLREEHMPYLVFIAHEGKTYHLINVGKGAAHKVVIAKVPSERKDTEEFDPPPYLSYSIPAGGYSDVHWATGAWMLFAKYEDLEGAKYLVQCVGNINEAIVNESLMNKIEKEAKRKEDIRIKML
ncbi:hypothetical protein [Flavihumibacter profundi]|uniref:hypothetical protein n=1 Tax=Flavihumibacter profundi TaxID=2716883 RepID=UPI001CC62BB6|nr:hypothetical protein [Flavihumibacter profundi]MBZ5859449.1 hypothetical protein [Flavihumibacter profundi]